jgi:serine O-acetyltransferase
MRRKSPGLLEQIREDYRSHYRAWHLPGFQAVVVHRFGKWTRTLPPLPRLTLRFFYKVGFFFVRNVYGIELPDTVKLGRRVVIGHQGGIVIHPNAEIGDDCVIRQGCSVAAATAERWSEQVPRLGSRVSMGAGSVVLGPVVVGDGARIGPNAVVVTNIPAGAMVVVDPPRVIRRSEGEPSAEARRDLQGSATR